MANKDLLTEVADTRNYLNEYLMLAKERCDKAKAKFFARLCMEYFENLAVVTIQVADRFQVACFVDDMPVFSYWLTKEQRQPLVGRMYKQGISGVKIAQFLKVSPATIYSDLKYLREVRPFTIEKRIERRDVRKSERMISMGDFKIAALNFQAQVLDMNRAFIEAHTSTKH